ncbi:MAG: hypothetical protein O2810_03470 [Bacteroidetes bacterium]|nr:hypothetical protein [Bacteroidota bacterium]MDA0888811.1 hypothetical protein [Bacteroidota bacterium]MDA1084574.1 hypothetical protein [Bacteroidota bacterium]
MSSKVQDIRLILKIENKSPIELLDLTKSLVALANNFDRYSSEKGNTKEDREAKLFVKEIKTGSVIIELIELATASMIPFVENINTVLEFASYFKSAIKFYLNNKGDDPELKPTEFREISTILNPVAKDKGSQFNLSTQINGNVNLNFNLNSNETNAIQNIFEREIKKLNLPQPNEEIEERQILTFYQARSDLQSKVGNKGIIESISRKNLNIVFDTEELKSEMLHSEINPLKTAYLVDIRIETINDKPKFYRVLKLHEYYDIDE